MAKITRPTPQEHLILVDTNILWNEDKSVVVNPEFDTFWDEYGSSFPMKLIVPEVVRGELLYQQTTSALKLLDKVNSDIREISKITNKSYSQKIHSDRIKKEVESRLDEWLTKRDAEVKRVPITDIPWEKVIQDSIWRISPFTADAKNPKVEKGFRDYMILETVCAICKFYSKDVNIAFICADYALRTASDSRLGQMESFTTFESIKEFSSFIELTKKNLTERFVKSILFRARTRFFSIQDDQCLFYKDSFRERLWDELKDYFENPQKNDPFSAFWPSQTDWKEASPTRSFVRYPEFVELVGDNEYHWRSRVTYMGMFERMSSPASTTGDRKLLLIPVDVFWKAKVRADGRFFECEIVKHETKEITFEVPTEAQIEQYKLTFPRGDGE